VSINGTTYTPRAGSVAYRTIDFFRANPDEELSVDDIVEKFEPSTGNVSAFLAEPIKHGLIMRERDSSGEYMFKAGPKLKGPMTTEPLAKAVQCIVPAPKVKRGLGVLALDLDLASIPLRDDVPMPGATGLKRKRLDYALLLDRMKVGQSAQLPYACRFTLGKAIKLVHQDGTGRRFTTRSDAEAGTLAVWRAE